MNSRPLPGIVGTLYLAIRSPRDVTATHHSVGRYGGGLRQHRVASGCGE